MKNFLVISGIIVAAAILFLYFSGYQFLTTFPPGYEQYGPEVFLGTVTDASGPITDTCHAGEGKSWEGLCWYYPADLGVGGSVEGETIVLVHHFDWHRRTFRPIDMDNDGILNSIDHCPEEAGVIENFGCPALPPQPPSQPPNPIFSFFDIVRNFINDLLRRFFGLFLITGIADTVNLGNTISGTVELASTTIPDNDYSDGTVTKIFATSFVTDSTGNILIGGEQTELTGMSYSQTISYKPAAAGKYVIGGLIVKTSTTYNPTTGQWNPWSSPERIAEDSKVVEVKILAGPTPPSISIGQLISNFINSIKSFLCSSFGIFC